MDDCIFVQPFKPIFMTMYKPKPKWEICIERQFYPLSFSFSSCAGLKVAETQIKQKKTIIMFSRSEEIRGVVLWNGSMRTQLVRQLCPKVLQNDFQTSSMLSGAINAVPTLGRCLETIAQRHILFPCSRLRLLELCHWKRVIL